MCTNSAMTHPMRSDKLDSHIENDMSRISLAAKE